MTLTAFEVTAPEASFDRVPSVIARPMSWRAALWSVVSVRWAAVALTLFLAGLVAQLNGASQGVWWTLYLACYLAGGWGSAWAGAQALRNKALDVDLLMIIAAIGAVAIGQIFDDMKTGVTAPEKIDAYKAASADVLAAWQQRGDPVEGVRKAMASIVHEAQ